MRKYRTLLEEIRQEEQDFIMRLLEAKMAEERISERRLNKNAAERKRIDDYLRMSTF